MPHTVHTRRHAHVHARDAPYTYTHTTHACAQRTPCLLATMPKGARCEVTMGASARAGEHTHGTCVTQQRRGAVAHDSAAPHSTASSPGPAKPTPRPPCQHTHAHARARGQQPQQGAHPKEHRTVSNTTLDARSAGPHKCMSGPRRVPRHAHAHKSWGALLTARGRARVESCADPGTAREAARPPVSIWRW